jgi:hypothetical protein
MFNQIQRRLRAVLASGAALALVLTTSLTFAPPAIAHRAERGHPAPLPALAVPVTGTLNDEPATGTLTIRRFVRAPSNEQPVSALGTLILKSATRTSVTQVTLPLTLPGLPGQEVSTQQISCEILTLSLGTLDLNLLGLTIHLDPVHLDVSAVPGAGNLLGNLLCAIVGLLDPFSLADLGTLLDLLNQLLGLLG